MFSFGKKRTKSNISTDSSSPEKTPAKKINTQHSDYEETLNYHSAGMANSDSAQNNDNFDFDGDIESIKFDENAPLYARQIWAQLKCLNNNVASMATSYNDLENKLCETNDKVKKVEDSLATCDKRIDQLIEENTKLKEKVTAAEAYSKKYNLLFYNIKESPKETSQILRDKVQRVVGAVTGIDMSPMYIDNIHRIPSASQNGIRPIIVKYVSYLDRDLIWGEKDRFQGHPDRIFIREHFPREMEEKIRQLLPIRRAAINQGIRAKLKGDKLIIKGKTYTTANLHTLQESLRPENVSTRKIDGHMFFFHGTCPLSNFHPSKFSIDGKSYSCGEQFLHEQKALRFNDRKSAQQIMEATTPQKMKELGSHVENFSESAWKDDAPEVLHRGLMEKFLQNPHLKHYLLSTGTDKLVEASRYDRWYGIGRNLWDENIMSDKEKWGYNLLGKTLQQVRQRIIELDEAEMDT